LEKRYVGKITIFDDIAHSPTKAKSVLENLKKIYTSKIYCIFEPNGGNRQPESIPGYDNNFVDADEVIIPRLTHIKQDPTKPQNLEGNDLAEIISKTHPNVKYIDDDEKLVNYLVENTNTDDVIVFVVTRISWDD
jgi:UDP-N-acetylmuramate-alanine ligase